MLLYCIIIAPTQRECRCDKIIEHLSIQTLSNLPNMIDLLSTAPWDGQVAVAVAKCHYVCAIQAFDEEKLRTAQSGHLSDRSLKVCKCTLYQVFSIRNFCDTGILSALSAPYSMHRDRALSCLHFSTTTTPVTQQASLYIFYCCQQTALAEYHQ